MAADRSPRPRALADLPRIRLHEQREHVTLTVFPAARRRGHVQAGRRDETETTDRAREVSCRSVCFEDEHLPRPLTLFDRTWSGRRRSNGCSTGDDVEFRRNRQAEFGRGVVGDGRLRMPVAAVAVDVLRLQSDLRRIDLLALSLDGNGLPFERLRLETTAVTHVEGELGVARNRRGQVDDDGVLADDSQMQESPELR